MPSFVHVDYNKKMGRAKRSHGVRVNTFRNSNGSTKYVLFLTITLFLVLIASVLI